MGKRDWREGRPRSAAVAEDQDVGTAYSVREGKKGFLQVVLSLPLSIPLVARQNKDIEMIDCTRALPSELRSGERT